MAPEELLPLLAAYLDRERDRLTRLWLASVRRSPDVPSARPLSDAEVADHLPKVFADLTRYLRDQDGAGSRTEVMRAAKDHGSQRGRQGYHPGEVLRELGMLHRTVVLEGLHPFLREHHATEKEVEPARDLVSRFFEDVAVASTGRFVEEGAAQLEAANRRLAAVDASRLQMLRTVTHELGGLLQTLQLGLAIALQETRETERRQMLSLCERNLGDMSALLEELRGYGMFLANSTHVERDTFDVREFAEDAAVAWRLQARDAGVEMQLRVDARLSEVESDRRRLRQVIGNLVANAIKYHDPAKTDCWVQLTFAPEGTDRWSVAVEDNGIGIAPENFERVFAEFGRGAPPPGIHGTGLGLTIARHLTETLGGQLRLRSEPGRGSRFEVTLPVRAGVTAPP